MRIAQVTLRFDAPGGVETNVQRVAKGLKAAGEDVRVFASDLYDEGRWEVRSDYAPTCDGVPVQRFPVLKRLVPGLTMPMMPGLIRALDAARPEIIHAHSHRYGHVLQAAAVAHARGIPLVVSTHYHPADRREPPLKKGLLRLQDFGFGASAYRVARALVVETKLEARLLSEFAPADRIRVIPPGVDLSAWNDSSSLSRPAGLPDQYLLYAGRIAPNKGLHQLIEALALLPPSERVPLVMLGQDWGERHALEALARARGVEGSILWLGHVAEEREFRAIYRGATVFVLPSEWEAFGLVLLEAMAAGLPIVATSVGGVPEVLANGAAGRLVPYGDPHALARTLGELLRDRSARAELSAAGHERVRAFTWDAAVERHRELYRELVGAGG